jgi:peptidoglycan/xylan/chitin deacetylase (PgdA/CDA1 family)
MVLRRLIGPKGKVPILIRDDDTNFFTDKRMLESIYSDAWNQGFKLSISVVPLQRGIDIIAVPPEMRKTNLLYSIGENTQLIDYLINKINLQAVEILQHGTSHDYSNDNFDAWGEFGANRDRRKEIELGRNILKSALKVQPRFFVPPGESLSRKNLGTVNELGLVPIYRQTLYDSFLRQSLVPDLLKRIATRLIKSRYYTNAKADEILGVQFIKPVIISIGNYGITWSLPNLRSAHLTSFQSLFRLNNEIIKLCSLNRNAICAINHYHLYYYDWSSTITKRDLLHAWRQILTSLDKIEFGWKTTFSELYERAKKIQNVTMVKTGSKITIESKAHVHEFAIQVSKPLEPNSFLVKDDMQANNIVTLCDLVPQNKIIIYEKS